MVLGLEDLGPVNLHQVMGANEVILTFLMGVIFTQKSTKVFHKKLISGCGIFYTTLRVCSHYLDSFCAGTILDRLLFTRKNGDFGAIPVTERRRPLK